MGYRRSILVSVVLLLFSVGPVLAQTGPVPPPAVARKQDREECTAQAAQQGITKRNRVTEFLRKCMAERREARNAAERQRLFERRIAERQEVERRAAKEADCKKQAREQNLRFRTRSRFIRECMSK